MRKAVLATIPGPDPNGGLEQGPAGVRVKVRDTSLSINSAGLGVNLRTNSGLQISSGLGVLLSGSSLTLSGAGLSLTDANRGDITVSSGGTTWTVNNNAITFAKLQDIATNTLIGRSSSGTGDPELITCTAFARSLLDDPDAATARTTLGLGPLSTATSPLGVTLGGTGLTTVAQGDLLYGSATNVITQLPKSTSATRYLANTGTSNNPAWDQVNLANGVTGTLPVPNGGTGITAVTQGDILYASATNTITQLPKSTAATRYLANTGTSNNPAWDQVNLTNGVTGILPMSNGGMGVNLGDPNANRIVFWNDSINALAYLTPSNGLTISGTDLLINLATNSGLEFTSGQLRIDLDTNPALALGSGGISVLRDNDSLQLSSGALFVRKLRDASSDPASPVGGEVWYNTSVPVPRFRTGIDTENIVGFLWDGIETRANSDNVGSSTTAETVFTKDSGASNVSYTFPANSLQPGMMFYIFFAGRCNTGTSGVSVRVRIRIGGVTGAVMWDSGPVTLASATTNLIWVAHGVWRILDSTTSRAAFYGHAGLSATNAIHTAVSIPAVNLDTTVANELVATVQFGVSNSGNQMFCGQFNVTRLGRTPN